MQIHRHHNEFIKITALNAGEHQRGICGFAAAYCFLLITQENFTSKVHTDNSKYKDDYRYQFGIDRLANIFPDDARFNQFIATNVMRWIKDNGNQISELKEFAIRWSDIHNEAVYNKDLPLNEAVFDMLVRVGIPLTPANILDILAHYSVMPQSLKLGSIPTIHEYFDEIATDAIYWADWAGVMGLAVDPKPDNVLLHKGLVHWVFFVNGCIYTWGYAIRTREEANKLSKCYHITDIYGLPEMSK